MKNFLYSLPVTLVTNLAFLYLLWNFFSLPLIVAYALYLVFYHEKATEYRKLKRQNKI
jgi:hypothetical protein